MKLIIDRKKWLRGEGSITSRLLRSSDEKQCCVGMYLGQLGVSRELLRDRSTPCDGLGAPIPLPVDAEWLVDGKDNSPAASMLYCINDPPDILEADRELDITAEFAKRGVEVKFR